MAGKKAKKARAKEKSRPVKNEKAALPVRQAHDWAPRQAEKKESRQWLVALIAVIAVAVIAFSIISSKAAPEKPAANTTGNSSFGAVIIDTASEQVRGDRNASVWIVEFGDYGCSFCVKAEENLGRLLQEKPGKIALIWKNFPLDSECNPVVGTPIHPGACSAAEASECAAEQGMFWEYHGKLLESQGRFDQASLEAYAEEAGMDAVDFKACMQSGVMKDEVRKDIEEAIALDVPGTPTFFINSMAFARWSDYAAFKRAVEEAEKSG